MVSFGAKTNLVALGAGLATTAATTTTAAGLAAAAAASGGLGALTRDVAGLAASVAGLGVLGSLGTVTACGFALGEITADWAWNPWLGVLTHVTLGWVLKINSSAFFRSLFMLSL